MYTSKVCTNRVPLVTARFQVLLKILSILLSAFLIASACTSAVPPPKQRNGDFRSAGYVEGNRFYRT